MGEKVISIDLGGTNFRVALVKDGKIINYFKKKTSKNKKDLLIDFVNAINEFNSRQVKGIGVSAPGPLINGVIKNPPNLPLQNFDLKNFLKRRYNKRVEVENDANCVALAEAKMGVKKKNFFVLTLGTGIGGGVVIDGEVYSGGGYASEPGHMIMDNNKDFETLWQENRKRCEKYFGKGILIKDLLKMKEKRAKEVVENNTRYLGQGISNLIDIFDPEIVVLSGGVRETGNKFLDMIRQQARKYTIIPRMPQIKWSKLDHPNIIGASLLIS